MINGRTAAKLAILLAPFLITVTGLHAFGRRLEGTAERLFKPERDETFHAGPYRIILPRGDQYHTYVRGVVERFVTSVRQVFPELGVPDPEEFKPITIHVVESRGDLPRELSEDPWSPNTFVMASDRRIGIVVRSTLRDQDEDRARLHHALTHVLLPLGRPDAQWSPWLAEGLAGYFEAWGAPDTVLRVSEGGEAVLPIRRILAARAGDFTGEERKRYARSSHLLVRFLLTPGRYREPFLRYCAEERKPGAVEGVAFNNLVADDLEALEREWQESLAGPK